MTLTYTSSAEIEARLPEILNAPSDNGEIKMLIVRRASNEREIRAEVYVSPEGGMEGDRWAKGKSALEPEHGDQLTLMNSRILELIAGGDPQRMALAGDNIVADFDLRDQNLTAGQQLQIGEVLLEVTATPHNGCIKFSERFGTEALKFINTPSNRYMHLRGIYVKVISPGVIRVGDRIKKN
ncbi:MAG: MOSC domain-containing protein [Bacteroidia bacterium]|nr:MOSC domain-containing protein [Bacteroidia bacterium]